MTIVTKTEKVDQKLRFSGNQNHWVFINDLVKEKWSLFFIGVDLLREVKRETQ
jgi:ethanolamine utilization protein EutQ (cupin superfamily)